MDRAVMTPALKEQLEQWIEREAKKRSLRQCSTGLKSLDEALQWHIEVGFESGAHSILPMLLVALDGLESLMHIYKCIHADAKEQFKNKDIHKDCDSYSHQLECFLVEGMLEDEDYLDAKEGLNKIKSMMEGNGND